MCEGFAVVRRVVSVCALVAAAATLASCTIGDAGKLEPAAHTSHASLVEKTTEKASPRPPKVNVANGETGVAPLDPITVSAAAVLGSNPSSTIFFQKI